jgi:hypothetical protein
MKFDSKFSKPSSTEQLDLVNTISDGDKLRRKRQLLIFLLILTIGLSLVFAVYRYLKNTLSTKTFPKISFNISLPVVLQTSDPSQNLNQVFKNGYSDWSVFVESGGFSWSKDFNQSLESQALTIQKEQLIKTPFITNGSAKSLLPEGVDLQQITDQSAPVSKFYFLLTVPKQQIFVVIYPPSADSTSLELVSTLVEKIYWSVIRPN